MYRVDGMVRSGPEVAQCVARKLLEVPSIFQVEYIQEKWEFTVQN